MLKIEFDRKAPPARLQATGSLIDVAADLSYVISEFSGHLYQHDPAAADFFKMAMVVSVTSPDSPTFKRAPTGSHVIVQYPKSKAE